MESAVRLVFLGAIATKVTGDVNYLGRGVKWWSGCALIRILVSND